MQRDVILIDEGKCNGCGACIPGCHEGALQVIDGKAVLVSELMCDGLGACLGHCPEGALSIEKREAMPYDEIKVMQEMIKKGKNVIKAHLLHLREHKEYELEGQAMTFLRGNRELLGFDPDRLMDIKPALEYMSMQSSVSHVQACPGSRSYAFRPEGPAEESRTISVNPVDSRLTHWPVQMHLINPVASHFMNADLLLCADCVGYAMGNFHSLWLAGKKLAIACPKLDSNKDIYTEKLVRLIDEARVNTLTVMMMEVPCCGGLLQLVKTALAHAGRKVPVKKVVVSVKGEVLSEEWT